MKNFQLYFFTILGTVSYLEAATNFSIRPFMFRDLRRDRRQTQSTCDGFKCISTDECIDRDKRCDGNVDCKDGSDEFNDCKTAISCPAYLFLCDYGACIDADKKCDGKKDCRDNSDEAHCAQSTLSTDKILSNCKSDQFECKSGQCISADDKCNGVPNCDDKSDETKEACLNMFCPGWTFKCDYGACVDGFAKCNGVKDCVDNSDEEDCAPVIEPTPKPTSKPDVVTQPSTTKGPCSLPEHPDFGFWKLLGNAEGYPRQKVTTSTVIEFGCNDNYKLSSELKYMACKEDGWNPREPPKCLQKCPALYSTDQTTIKCVNNGVEVRCDEATDGTSATFDCAAYYEPEDRTKSTRFCWSGQWNKATPKCQPVCGEKRVTATPLIVNGQKVEKGDYPWSTAIFYVEGSGAITNVCGGSILTQTIILTAAHCVTDEYAKAVPKEDILVGVGKFYNKYKDPRDTQAQYSKLSKLIVHENYKGDYQRFANDIALLITKDKLLLSKVVQPVCYQDLSSFHLDIGLLGVITGWGFTTRSSTPSDELLEINVPYTPDSVCLQELPTDFTDKYFTPDKMCAGHYNKSTAVCRGDSGGALAFKNRDGRFYVHGIVSVSNQKDGGCDIQSRALFTKVADHYEWLEKHISKYNQ